MDTLPKKASGHRTRLSAKRRSALRLHGRYIGYVRQLKKREKAAVKKIRAAEGVRAAIGQARRLLLKAKAA